MTFNQIKKIILKNMGLGIELKQEEEEEEKEEEEALINFLHWLR